MQYLKINERKAGIKFYQHNIYDDIHIYTAMRGERKPMDLISWMCFYIKLDCSEIPNFMYLSVFTLSGYIKTLP